MPSSSCVTFEAVLATMNDFGPRMKTTRMGCKDPTDSIPFLDLGANNTATGAISASTYQTERRTTLRSRRTTHSKDYAVEGLRSRRTTHSKKYAVEGLRSRRTTQSKDNAVERLRSRRTNKSKEYAVEGLRSRRNTQ